MKRRSFPRLLSVLAALLWSASLASGQSGSMYNITDGDEIDLYAAPSGATSQDVVDFASSRRNLFYGTSANSTDVYGVETASNAEFAGYEVSGGCDVGCGGKHACGCDVGKDGCGCDGGKDGCSCSCYLFGPDEPISLFDGLFADHCGGPTIGGWAEYGYHDNNVPMSFTRGDLLAFGDLNTWQLNQAWLYIEKEADGSCGWDWGYRFDVMYGTDAQKTQAFGNPDLAGQPGVPRGWDNTWDKGVYGFAAPQAYVSFANGDLSVIAGHFYTLVGYEVVTAPDNFFYTHAYTMFNSEPFTHTGVLATYAMNENTEVYAGWTLGWDTGFDQFANGNSYLGGWSTSLSDELSVTYISTSGNLGVRGTQAYTHSIVIDATLTENLQYVCQSDLVLIGAANPAGAIRGFGPGVADDQVGINQYLFYSLSDCIKLGGRFEWWKNDGVSYNEITAGVNYRPHANLTIRPEIRYDWLPSRSPTAVTLFPANVRSVTTFSVDAVVTF